MDKELEKIRDRERSEVHVYRDNKMSHRKHRNSEDESSLEDAGFNKQNQPVGGSENNLENGLTRINEVMFLENRRQDALIDPQLKQQVSRQNIGPTPQTPQSESSHLRGSFNTNVCNLSLMSELILSQIYGIDEKKQKYFQEVLVAENPVKGYIDLESECNMIRKSDAENLV